MEALGALPASRRLTLTRDEMLADAGAHHQHAMLGHMLLLPRNAGLFAANSLPFIVLDEIHTYHGARDYACKYHQCQRGKLCGLLSAAIIGWFRLEVFALCVRTWYLCFVESLLLVMVTALYQCQVKGFRTSLVREVHRQAVTKYDDATNARTGSPRHRQIR